MRRRAGPPELVISTPASAIASGTPIGHGTSGAGSTPPASGEVPRRSPRRDNRSARHAALSITRERGPTASTRVAHRGTGSPVQPAYLRSWPRRRRDDRVHGPTPRAAASPPVQACMHCHLAKVQYAVAGRRLQRHSRRRRVQLPLAARHGYGTSVASRSTASHPGVHCCTRLPRIGYSRHCTAPMNAARPSEHAAWCHARVHRRPVSSAALSAVWTPRDCAPLPPRRGPRRARLTNRRPAMSESKTTNDPRPAPAAHDRRRDARVIRGR